MPVELRRGGVELRVRRARRTSSTAAIPSSAMSHRSIAETIIGNIVAGRRARPSRPTARQIAFVVTRTDLPKNTYLSQVWLTSADGSARAAPGHRRRARRPADLEPRRRRRSRSRLARSAKKGETTLHVMPDRTRRRGAHDRHDARRRRRRRRSAPTAAGSRSPAAPATSATRRERTRAGRRHARSSGSSPSSTARAGCSTARSTSTSSRADGTATPRNLTPGEFQHGGIAWTRRLDGDRHLGAAPRHVGPRLRRPTCTVVPLDGDDRRAHRRSTGNYIHAVGLARRHDRRVPRRRRLVARTRRTCTSASSPSTAARTAVDQHRARPHVRDHCRHAAAACGSTATTLLATAEDRGQTHLFRVVHRRRRARGRSRPGAITVKSFDAAGGTIACRASARSTSVADLFVRRPTAHRAGSPTFAARYAHDGRAARRGSGSPCRRTDGTRRDRRVDHATGRLRPAEQLPRDAQRARRPAHAVRRDLLRRGPVPGRGRLRRADEQPARRRRAASSRGARRSWARSTRWRPAPAGAASTSTTCWPCSTPRSTATRSATPTGSACRAAATAGYMATCSPVATATGSRRICSERAVNNMLSEEWSQRHRHDLPRRARPRRTSTTPTRTNARSARSSGCATSTCPMLLDPQRGRPALPDQPGRGAVRGAAPAGQGRHLLPLPRREPRAVAQRLAGAPPSARRDHPRLVRRQARRRDGRRVGASGLSASQLVDQLAGDRDARRDVRQRVARYHCASTISVGSHTMSPACHSARKPIIRLCGNGHGWLPR